MTCARALPVQGPSCFGADGTAFRSFPCWSIQFCSTQVQAAGRVNTVRIVLASPTPTRSSSSTCEIKRLYVLMRSATSSAFALISGDHIGWDSPSYHHNLPGSSIAGAILVPKRRGGRWARSTLHSGYARICPVGASLRSVRENVCEVRHRTRDQPIATLSGRCLNLSPSRVGFSRSFPAEKRVGIPPR